MKGQENGRRKEYGFDDVKDQLLRLLDFFLCICHDQTVEIFFLVASVSGVRSAFSFLNRAFASDCNFGSGLGLHFLEGISTRSDQ